MGTEGWQRGLRKRRGKRVARKRFRRAGPLRSESRGGYGMTVQEKHACGSSTRSKHEKRKIRRKPRDRERGEETREVAREEQRTHLDLVSQPDKTTS